LITQAKVNTKWTNEETDLLVENFYENSYKELSLLLGRTVGAVRGKSERIGLKKYENKLWGISEEKFLSKNYGTLPPVKIAFILNRTLKSVGLKAYYMGLTNKYTYKYHKPNYNENFFCNWSKELAWLVGIVLSDGHVSKNEYKLKFIRIRMCDKDVIYKIKSITGYKSNVYEYEPKNHYKTSYTITFCGELVWNFFTKLGMDNNKSVTAKFPKDIHDILISHVIRGIFDGDGSITINKGKYLSARICGTKNVVYGVRNYIDLHHTIHVNKSGTNFIIQYTGERALSFLEYIYNGSNENNRMDRKYDIYIKYINLK